MTLERSAVALGAFAVVAGTGAAHGAYFPESWGWTALALGWLAALGLVLHPRPVVGAAGLGALGALALLVVWVGLSISWSADKPQSVLELERDLVYLLGAAAMVINVRRETVTPLLAGVLAAIVALACFALLTRFFPPAVLGMDEILVNRLARPLGYWNALGAFAAIAMLLAVGYVARGASLAGRMAAGAALPILATTLYLTYSRGALVALAVGLAAALAMETRRLRLLATVLALAVPSGTVVALASRAQGLATAAPPRALAVADGHRLALIVLAAIAVSAACAGVVAMSERTLRLGPNQRRAVGATLVAVVVVAVFGATAQSGGPASLVDRGYRSFLEDRPPAGASTEDRRRDLNKRLFTLRGNGRLNYWRSALRQHDAAPWVGGGAGTFEQWWLARRTINSQVRDAHGLYFEVLGELGWVGLLLLVTVLALPLTAITRARKLSSWAPYAFGGYATFVVHAGVDWGWEMVTLTLTGLACGFAVLGAGGDRRLIALPRWGRALGGVTIATLVAFSLIGMVANRSVARAGEELDAGRPREALESIDEGIRWAPWAGRGWQIRGAASLQLGRVAAARRDFAVAAQKDPSDWSIWLDLGYASSGPAQRRAFVHAARLNPLHPNVEAVREAGYRLAEPAEAE